MSIQSLNEDNRTCRGASGILRNSYESMFLKHIFKSLVGIVINPRLILKLLLKTIIHKLNMKCDEI